MSKGKLQYLFSAATNKFAVKLSARLEARGTVKKTDSSDIHRRVTNRCCRVESMTRLNLAALWGRMVFCPTVQRRDQSELTAGTLR